MRNLNNNNNTNYLTYTTVKKRLVKWLNKTAIGTWEFFKRNDWPTHLILMYIYTIYIADRLEASIQTPYSDITPHTPRSNYMWFQSKLLL